MPVNNTTNTTSFSYLQYKNKISGLASGMDIDSMMEKLMKAESAQMEKLQVQKQKYEWKRDAYRDVNTKLNTFQKDLFDKYGLQSNWNSKTSNVSTNNSVKVEAGGSASGNLSISEISIAKNASNTFTSSNVSNERISGSTLINDIQGLSDQGKLQLQSYAGGTGSVNDLISKFESEGIKLSLTNGQFKLTEQSNTSKLSSDAIDSLKNIGMTFNDAAKQSIQLKNADDTIATSGSKLSDLGLNSGTIILIAGEKNETIDLGALITNNPDATMKDLLKEVDSKGFNASFIDGKLAFSSKDAKESLEVTSDNSVLKDTFSPVLKSATSSTFVTNTTNPTKLTSNSTIQDLLGGSSSEKGEFTLNSIQADGKMKETKITFTNSDSIDSLMKKINSSNAGVTAIFNNGTFGLSANNTGDNAAGAEISLVQPSGIVNEEQTKGMALFAGLTGKADLTLAENGRDATMVVNGVEYKQSSNVFKVAGYEITATADLSNTSAPITVSSTPDTEKAVDKVKQFVEMYNGLVKELNDRTSEKRKLGYEPLTDAQKSEMTEAEVKKWEETAKLGLLKSDSTLNNVLSKMRNTLTTYGTSTSGSADGSVFGIKGETLKSLGISTSKSWEDNGKLEIDEDKLRAAINKDPNIITRVFAGDGTKENPGVVSQLRTAAQDAVKTIEKSAGKSTSASDLSYSLGKTINSIETKITDWKDRLKSIEERYWKQFSAMENAIQKANSQSAMFMQ
ncbi:hypothetical protein KZO01_18130 [Kurthia zopfii]|uniref:Flagellar hook-associated protein 2 n=1 Tax=Kurthia zopfii TaxID=1650 RepID=A0A8B4Q753_9BACL|nr:flagellar filament capping protein FliD [Kurthia zopfii]PWI22632.1 hypothetical protein DF281_06145 [Kurthia zopfii]TDR39266.1 flagellar capping protein FliD [Kurthia zopfii]GEK31504.1 hypothetical protein KZO01_18130 [Kurthia zopfii]STX08811.1 Flagellar cap protein [Kurthia zopfii]